MAIVGLSAPWVIFYREIMALVGSDPEVHVVFDYEDKNIYIHVDDVDKAQALEYLMLSEVRFGDTTVSVNIIPCNEITDEEKWDIDDMTLEEIFLCGFNNNPNFSFTHIVHGIFANDMVYVVFKNKVIQYFSDNLGDIHGLTSTLCEDIAKHVLKNFDNVFYCTDVEQPVYLGAPLGEWPQSRDEGSTWVEPVMPA